MRAGISRSWPTDLLVAFGSSFDAATMDFNDDQTIYIRIYSASDPNMGFFDAISVSRGFFLNGYFIYRSSTGGISVFMDTNRKTFYIVVNNADLTSLRSSVTMEIEIGDYFGSGTAYDGEVQVRQAKLV